MTIYQLQKKIYVHSAHTSDGTDAWQEKYESSDRSILARLLSDFLDTTSDDWRIVEVEE